MKNPTPKDLAPILAAIVRHADLTAEVQLLGAQIQHAVYNLKKSCGVPRDPDVILDDARGIWVRIVGKNEQGKPITKPLIEPAKAEK